MTTTDTAKSTPDYAEAEQLVIQLLTKPPADPYPVYARLREIDPIHRASIGDFWTVTRYDDIQKVISNRNFVRDYDDFRSRNSKGKVDYERPFIRAQRQWFIFSNPPEYAHMRARYGKAFSPRFVEDMRPLITDLTNEILDEASERGELELVRDFGYALTLRVVCRLIGLPLEEGEEQLVAFSRALGPTFDPLVTEEQLKTADAATVTLEAFMADLVTKLRQNPGDDLLSELVKLEAEGEAITDAELTANAALVFNAGVETTTHFIGNCMLSLLSNRDQWELFASDPEGHAKNAIEELLRYESSVQADLPLRLAASDIEVGGVTIKAGECVIPFYGAGNRDPARYDDPDRLDITRQNIETLSFGGGAHICLGQYLARVETEIALIILAQRFPNMEMIDDGPHWRPEATNRGLRDLRVRLNA